MYVSTTYHKTDENNRTLMYTQDLDRSFNIVFYKLEVTKQ